MASNDGGNLTFIYSDTLQACVECRIELDAATTIADSAMLWDVPTVERDRLGRYYVVMTGAPHSPIIVYGPKGERLRSVGRRGSGPGEYHRVSSIFVGRADSLYMIGENRFAAYDADGRLGRTFRFAPLLDSPAIVDVTDEGVVVSSFTLNRGPATPSAPLTVYNGDGEVVRTYGPLGEIGELAKARTGHTLGKRPAAVAPDGSVWLRDIGYLFEQVQSDGTVTSVIGVATPPSWNIPVSVDLEAVTAAAGTGTSRVARTRVTRLPADTAYVHTPTSPPPARLDDFALLNDSLMLVALHVPAEDWALARGRINPSTVQHTEDGPQLLPGFREALYDTVLDLINTSSGVLVVRTRVPGMLRLTSDATLYKTSFSQDGYLTIQTFVVRLVR